MPTSAVPTPDEIWKILKETAAIQKRTSRETAAIQKEIRKELKEAAATQDRTDKQQERNSREIAAIQKRNSREIAELRLSQKESSREADRRMKETERLMKESGRETDRRMKETDRRMKETDQRMKETDRQIKKTEAQFNSRWGKLIESLVEGDLLPILRQKGIDVYQIHRNVKERGRGDDFEYDIIAVNGQEVVVVEVKTTLRVQDVKDFLESVRKFTTRLPRFQGNIIYGAVAWLQVHEESDTYAEKQGLFVIRATGSSASLVNQEDFRPQVFS